MSENEAPQGKRALAQIESDLQKAEEAFVDADKGNYVAYWERLVKLVRPGGLILVDNVLWSGRVLDPDDDSEDTRAIRALNERVSQDDRVTPAIVPVGDGLTVARVR